ncbi:hypothetical protein HMPREF9526_01546 [Enterococcus faecium TX0133B]|nr:hypothetical protein HMPREF9526_01546 [Enterococcus faecium TX0133B]
MVCPEIILFLLCSYFNKKSHLAFDTKKYETSRWQSSKFFSHRLLVRAKNILFNC